MHSPDGRFHIVHNGEIYNFRELRRELSSLGHAFRTDTDTEVILSACAHWGTEALARFNGMWAIAFFDALTCEGFLSRDRFGVKPLVYTCNHASLCFASELDALPPLGEFDDSIDGEAVAQHLQFGYVAHPRTIYRSARKLAPGCLLRFNAHGATPPQRWYQLPATPALNRSKAYAETCTDLRRALADSVMLRRVSDVPIGAFLSGGLDSSIVVAHLSAALGRPVQTFSVGYADHKSYDETHYARIVAARFGAQHHECILTQRDVLEAVPRILDHLPEPVGDSSIVPTSLVSRFAREHVTVALSGDGGDELFGGYWRYLGHDLVQAYQSIPRFVRRYLMEPILAGLATGRSSSLADRARQFRKLQRATTSDPLLRHLAWSRILAPEAVGLFRDPDTHARADAETAELARTLTAAMNGADPLNRILAFDLQHQLPADMLQKVDLAGMMHSLEIRVPFLDFRVVAQALAMPSSFKIHRGLRKRILVDAYRGLLPDEILDRPKKGFEVPFGEYLCGPLRPMFEDVVTREAIDSFGLLSYPVVETTLADHLARRADHADVLWALLSLCWWRSRRSAATRL